MSDIKYLDRDSLGALLAGMELEASVDTSGLLYCVFPADDDFDHDVVFHFTPDDDGWFGIEAIADGFDMSGDRIGEALAFCNSFNSRARMPKAYVTNGRIKLDQWIVFPGSTDDDYVRQYIELVLTMCWSFYVNAKKKLNSKYSSHKN